MNLAPSGRPVSAILDDAVSGRRISAGDAHTLLVEGDLLDLGLAADAVRNADLVILCTPVGAYGPVMADIRQALMPGAILSDVGSVKGYVQKLLAPLVPQGVHLIPAHPIAGTEHSGPAAGFAD